MGLRSQKRPRMQGPGSSAGGRQVRMTGHRSGCFQGMLRHRYQASTTSRQRRHIGLQYWIQILRMPDNFLI